MREGDRVRYVGWRGKYRSNGTVTRGFVGLDHGTTARIGDAHLPLMAFPFWVEFDNGESGLFSHESDFMPVPAVDQLADLARENS